MSAALATTDPTMALVDLEPWNQRPEPAPIEPTVEALHTVYYRVVHRLPIFAAPGQPARFVYDACSYGAPGSCHDCGLGPVEVAIWQEWEWKPGKGLFDYLPTRCFDLCEVCAEAVRRLPSGQRWHRSRSRSAVLARCIRSLEAVGHVAAVEALRKLEVRP